MAFGAYTYVNAYQDNGAASTTLTDFGITASAGALVIMTIVAPNAAGASGSGTSSEVTSVTTPSGGTWKKAAEYRYSPGGVAGDGVINSVWYLEVTANMSNVVPTITFSSARSNKLAWVDSWARSTALPIQVDATAAHGGTEVPQSLTVSGLSGEHLFYRTDGSKNETWSVTNTSGWTTTGTNQSATGGANGRSQAAEYKIATAASATSQPTAASAPRQSVLLAFSEGTPGRQGSLAVQLNNTTISAAGTVINPRTGTLAVQLNNTTINASGGTQSPRTGTLSNQLNNTTISASGIVRNPIAGAASLTLNPATISAAGKAIAGGALNQTLAPTLLDADGGIVLSPAEQSYLNWLSDDSAARVIIAELNVLSGGSETVRYISNVGYTTSGSDTPAHTVYEPCIVGGVTISESMSVDGDAGMQFGDFEIDNSMGDKTAWLQDVWMNRSVNIYFGDASWPRSQFRLIMSGVIFSMDSRQSNRLNIVIRDKMQRLNTPITENKLGGITLQSDALLPLTFGEVHNIEPLLISPAMLMYQYHQGRSEGVIEVRDNGVPINVTKDLTSSTFFLLAQPAGTITCSVQGSNDPGYVNTVAQVVRRIATQYGKATDRFTDADIDLTNFAQFELQNPQPIGLYVSERVNVIEVLQQVVQSVGAQLVMSREGLLRLVRVQLPPPQFAYPSQTVTERDMVTGTFQIVNRNEVKAAVKVAYCRNWTVQENLETLIPTEHKLLFKQEWLTETVRDTTVANNYRLHKEPDQEETLLLVRTDAANEAQRRLDLRKQQRTTYRFDGFASCLRLTLGQAIIVQTSVLGLDAGVTGMVTSLEPDWMAGRCGVEFIV